MSDARDEKPLVVEMLSSSCCELESLISFTREKLEEAAAEKELPWKGGWVWAEEVEGWEKRAALPEPPRAEGASRDGKWRWERLRGGLDRM